jgi:hypothetical protein
MTNNQLPISNKFPIIQFPIVNLTFVINLTFDIGDLKAKEIDFK